MLNINATPNDASDGFVVTVTAAATAALAAGLHSWIRRVTKEAEVYTTGVGQIEILPNLATAAAGALQSHAEKMVVALEAEIAARVDGTGSAHTGLSFQNRSIELIPLPELHTLLNKYRMQLAMKNNGGRLPPVEVRFVRP